MSKALEGVTSILETLANKHNGFEVSVKSTFIYAFSKPVHAMNFCLRAQKGRFPVIY